MFMPRRLDALQEDPWTVEKEMDVVWSWRRGDETVTLDVCCVKVRSGFYPTEAKEVHVGCVKLLRFQYTCVLVVPLAYALATIGLAMFGFHAVTSTLAFFFSVLGQALLARDATTAVSTRHAGRFRILRCRSHAVACGYLIFGFATLAVSLGESITLLLVALFAISLLRRSVSMSKYLQDIIPTQEEASFTGAVVVEEPS